MSQGYEAGAACPLPPGPIAASSLRPDPDVVPGGLRAFFAQNPRLALAYSGGTDSAFLLACALACGVDVRPYTVTSQFQFPFEGQDAEDAAAQLGVRPQVLRVDVMAACPALADNPPERCYLCKGVLLRVVAEQAHEDGYAPLVDGTNASDDPSRRPGMRALEEYCVRSPLREVGLTKDDVRALSRTMGLMTAGKPSYSCRATHLPHGTRLTLEALESVQVEGWR